jgi:drug/metabolite transporter (DMT)-like permease
MSLLVAVPTGVAAAIAYGASTAVQHSAAHTGTGEADTKGLLNLLRNPRWLLSVGGDAVGLTLQVIALATGPVVVIQPLLVLAVPVSLPVGRLLGGPRPRGADLLACLGIVGGLAGFFGLVGDPGAGKSLTPWPATVTIVAILLVGAAVCWLVHGRSALVRAGGYGGVAGAWFGLVGVLLNGVATIWQDHGLHAFGHAQGLVPLVGLLLVGALAMTLTQVSFQVGALGASFPANESAAPVVAVLLGALLLHERVPISALSVLGYLVALAVVVLGTIRLANPGGGRPDQRTTSPEATRPSA